MGLLDFFRKFKKNKSTDNDLQKNNIPNNDIKIKYSSGTEAKIDFTNVVDYDGKHLQEVYVTYTDKNGQFITKQLYMEPHIGLDKNGRAIYDTKLYFQGLTEANKGLVKGFFEQTSVNSMKTNYIGEIGQDSNGRYNRTLDYNFIDKYSKIIEAQKAQKDELEAQRKIQENNKLKEDLKKKTNNGYQNWCDNYDKYYGHHETLDNRGYTHDSR